MNRPSDRPLRVAFLTNFVSPYRRPVYESLGRTEGWDFRVFTNAATEFDRHWEVDTSQLDVVVSKTWTKRRTIQHEVPVAYEEVVSLHVPTGLFGDLRRFRPDIILSSELGPRTIVASAYGALHRVPVGIWSYHSRTSAACGAKQLRVRRALLGRAAVAIGMGTQAREVLRGWGVEDERIVDALNTTDLTTLESRLAAPEIDGRAQAIKDRIAPGKRIALVLGRLIPLKGIPELLESWGELPESVRDEWELVFVGDGPYKELVESHAGASVTYAGRIGPEEVGDWFYASDLHIFASLGDVWGLVVNEASAASTPTLCSVHAGCSSDLVEHGESGLLFDPGDPATRTGALLEALQHPNLKGLGEAARETGTKCSIEGLANGFRNAVNHVYGPPSPRAVEGHSARAAA